MTTKSSTPLAAPTRWPRFLLPGSCEVAHATGDRYQEMFVILSGANELSPDWISCGIGWEPVTGGAVRE
jgi:hypothetical protein